MAEPKDAGKKKAKKKRAEPVYVPVGYPVWLGAVSFAWAVLGWLVAAFAPRLAFVPLAGAVHLLLPTVTVGLLGANLYFAVRSLLRGAHVLRLALVTGVEVALFTTLFFQLYAHVGAELYDAPGPTSPWQWFAFSAAHAFRAGDVFDAVEALGWGIQPVKHTSPLVGVFVIAYHVVVDVFFLGLVWAGVGRVREMILADDEFRGMLVRFGLGAFGIWFITWVVVAFFVRPWRMADVALWWVENVLRVVDFADVMESFGLRLHTLPREGVVGWLTVLCRMWIGIGLAVALTRKRKPPPRRVLTPPGVEARSYWGLRAGALAGMAVVLFAAGVAGWLAAGSSADALVAAVKEGPDARAESALRALRRMGPSAGPVVEPLVAARKDAPPAVRDGITRTLGYLGTSAAPPLRDIALTEPAASAGLAVDALAEVGGPAAPALVAVWDNTTDDAVKTRADAAIRRVGGDGVAPLIDGFTPENAHGHYVWLGRLDPNWRLRSTNNPTARACHDLDDLKSRACGGDAAAAAAAMNQARACGTAARELLEVASDALDAQDVGHQAAAAGIVVAAGPSQTPKLLARARATPAQRAVPPGVLAALNDPSMWPPAVLDDPNTLPALLALVNRPETFPVALRHLGHYGPAAAPAAAVLIPRVADLDENTRAAVRAALARVQPKWKDDPALDAALPTLLYQLPRLPAAEADELYAALRPVTEEKAAPVAAAVEKQLRDVNERYTGRGSWDKSSPEAYAKSLDEVFGPVERLGPKAKGLVPTFQFWVQKNAKTRNDPKPRIVNARLALTLPKIGGSAEESVPATMANLGFGPAGLAYLRRQGKAAVPFVGELLDSRDSTQQVNGLKAAAALGRDAEPLVPRMLALFPDSNRLVRAEGRDDIWLMGEVARALTAVEPAWWGRPEATAPLGRMLQLTAPDNDSKAARQRVLDLVAGTDPAAAPKIAAEVVRAGVVDPPVKDVFDKVAPGWRTDPAVKAAAPEMAGRIATRDVGLAAERAVLDLGPTGVEAVTATLAGLSDEVVAGQSGIVKGAELRDRSVTLLAKFDPPAKAAVPALLALAAKPKLQVEAVPGVVEALDKISPGWADDAEHKDAVKAAADALLARAAENPLFVGHAGRFGAAVGPELVKQFEGARSDPEAVGVLARIAAAGPAAKGALPALTKRAADKDGRNRPAVIDAIGKVAAGDPAVLPTLVPLILDPDAKVRAAVGPALERVDPKWKTKPAAKALATTAKGQLTAADAGKRAAGADVLGLLGDAAQVPALTPVVLDTDPGVRAAAGKALDTIDADWRAKPAAKQAVAAAVKQLADPAARKRFDAVGALDVLRPPTAVAPLEQLIARETDANTRSYAEDVLGRIRKGP